MLPLLLLSACFLTIAPSREQPFYHSELIFPLHAQHNHGSCIVETPRGDLLVCWYRGSGERQADDVAVFGARKRHNAKSWYAPFIMADTPGFPDTNPCMKIDDQNRLWLFYLTVLDNHWESGLLKAKTSTDYERNIEPRWKQEDVIVLKPGPEFSQTVQRDLDRQYAPYKAAGSPVDQKKLTDYLQKWKEMANTKLSTRLGWMTRAHPTILQDNRFLVPLYSDGFDFSLMAYTDDHGKNWKVSEPLIGPGNVQPSVVQRKDGSLVAYFRDNGPPPQRVMVSESRDNGQTWSPVHDTELYDPGAGLEAIVLKSGRWLLVNNDTEEGRHSLAIHISEDEGKTWPKVRHLERDEPGDEAGSYSYPSITQGKDGSLHVTYSYNPNKAEKAKKGAGESIKYAHFNEAWLLGGDKP